MFRIFACPAEYNCNLIQERTYAGIATAPEAAGPCKMHGASACENTAVDRRMVLRQHLEDEIPLTQLAHRPLQHGPLNHGWPRPVDAHSFPIDELLRQAGVPLFDLNDGTLSSGEMATARITSALRRLGQARWLLGGVGVKLLCLTCVTMMTLPHD